MRNELLEKIEQIATRLEVVENLCLDIKDPLRHVAVPEMCEKCDYLWRKEKMCSVSNRSLSETEWVQTICTCGRTVNGKRIEWRQEKGGEE